MTPNKERRKVINKKDIAKLLKACEDQGFTLKARKTGDHVGVFRPDGSWVTDITSGGSDHRGMRNALAALKRAGFIWPPPRK